MIFLYRTGISIYVFAIRVASLFYPKARLWVSGRKGWKALLESRPDMADCTWVHCSSLGEFEQGRPVIEALREKFPGTRILLTFFSPSGYEIRKNYPYADLVMYLPADTPSNARTFLNLVRPQQVIFVKYDLWYFFLEEIRRRSIRAFLISAVFREGHFLLKSWARPFARSLEAFSVIFTQEEASKQRISRVRTLPVVIAGDTRIDRMMQVKNDSTAIPEIENFVQGQKVVVFGSVWPADMKVVAPWINRHPEAFVIIAPHDVSTPMVKEIRAMLTLPSVLYSEPEKSAVSARILLVDRIGLLNRIYRYAWLSYIGGGFGKSIHNTLEPAVYGIPVITGPQIHKFPEALQMNRLSTLFIVENADDFARIMDKLEANEALLAGIRENQEMYFSSKTRATDLIVSYLSGRQQH